MLRIAFLPSVTIRPTLGMKMSALRSASDLLEHLRKFLYSLRFLCCALPLATCILNALAYSDAQEPDTPGQAPRGESGSLHVNSLIQRVTPSIVTIRVKDRDGGQLSIGTGFVVHNSGLIATNYHVLTEGRAFSVELWPKKALKVLAVEATEAANDLAIIRVEPPIEGLNALPMAEDEVIQQGISVLAFGHPLGLEHSVVRGIVSAVRELQGQPRIQLAMPIEPGNSGGPLVDEQGKVLGIVNMKSLQTDNLGFAVPIAGIRSLMINPNPMLIDRWVRSAAIDEQSWKIVFEADWKEQSGKMTARGLGVGFGGRSLCLCTTNQPESPFELSVQVKLNDEAGAAGLVFHSDGKDRHYGFYPSGGNLRLTCFQGPFVDSWQVIREVSSKHYKAGQWNELKVRAFKDGIQCYVNGHLAIESPSILLDAGSVGLAKFRNTVAEFKRFHVGTPTDVAILDASNKELLDRLISDSTDFSDSKAHLASVAAIHSTLVKELARKSEKLQCEVDRLQKLARDVATAPALSQLRSLLDHSDGEDLCRGALWIAAMDNPDLDVEVYVRKLEGMAQQIVKGLKDDASPSDRIAALNRFLFAENGFHGSRQEYYHRANSHLDRVIDDREGLPITLAILYIDLARRIGVDLHGIGLPGHFVVGFHKEPTEDLQLIDVFDGAKFLSRQDGERMIMEQLHRRAQEVDFRPQSIREVLVRVLRNLTGIAQNARDDEALVRYSSGLVALDADEPQYRMMRCIARYRTGRLQVALEDLRWLQGKELAGLSAEEMERLSISIEKELAE